MNQFNQNPGQSQFPQYTPEQIAMFRQNFYNEQLIQKQKKQQISEILKVGFILGAVLIMYLINQVIGIAVLKLLGLMDAYDSSSLVQHASNIIIVHFFSMMLPFCVMALATKKHYTTPLIPTQKVGKSLSLAWYGLGIGCCMAANYITAFIQFIVKETSNYELTQPELNKPNSLLSCVIAVIAVSIIPGICEEIAFRGAAMGLLRKYGKGFAVFAVSLVFGLAHGNIIQFIFAFMVGLVLAYITMKTNNILIAMFIHATNNGLAVIGDILNYLNLEKVDNIVTMVLYSIFAVSGVLGAIALIRKKELIMKKEPKKPYDNPFIVKVLALLPGMIVPISFLIYSTITTIVKK